MLEAGGSFAGVNRKVQLKPTKWSEPEEGSGEQPRVTEALLILKHGGVLTHAGRQQACACYFFACVLTLLHIDVDPCSPVYLLADHCNLMHASSCCALNAPSLHFRLTQKP